MTDLEHIKQMFDSQGFKYEVVDFSDATTLTIERGYSGFATTFTFDLNGKFKDIGAYE